MDFKGFIKRLGIDPQKDLNATLKRGINYKDWYKKGKFIYI